MANMKHMLIAFLLAAVPLGACGFAAQPNSNKSKKQLEEQMRSLRTDLKKTKTMINNNNNGQSMNSGKIVASDNTSKEVLKAIRNTSKEVTSLKKEFDSFSQSQLFSAAIRNAEFNSFDFYDLRNRGRGEDSAALVRKMLFAFQRDSSYTVYKEMLFRPDPWMDKKDENDKLVSALYERFS